jgi:hypothetical protein
MSSDPQDEGQSTYLYVERNDDGYVAELRSVYDGHVVETFFGRDRAALEPALRAAWYDFNDADISLTFADRCFAAGRTADQRFFEDLRWRAKKGNASSPDLARLVNELERANSPFMPSWLLPILGHARAVEHEAVLARYLYASDTDAIIPSASWAIVQCGLLNKHEDRFIELLRLVDGDEFVHMSIMSQMHTVLKTERRPRILSALCDVAESAPHDTRLRNRAMYYSLLLAGLPWDDAFGVSSAATDLQDALVSVAIEQLRAHGSVDNQ